MENSLFVLEFPFVKTMAPLYKLIFDSYMSERPLIPVVVNVVAKLTGALKSYHCRAPEGYEVILLKKDKMKTMKNVLISEIERIDDKELPLQSIPIVVAGGADGSPAVSVDDIAPFDKRIMDIVFMQLAVMEASKCLGIDAPQILLLDNYPTRGFSQSEENMIFINRNFDLISIALHELRHIWQKRKHPELFDHYIPYEVFQANGTLSKEEKSAYYSSQIAEFDADAFSFAFQESFLKSYDIPLIKREDYEDLFDKSDFRARRLAAMWELSKDFNTPVCGAVNYDRIPDYKSYFPEVA